MSYYQNKWLWRVADQKKNLRTTGVYRRSRVTESIGNLPTSANRPRISVIFATRDFVSSSTKKPQNSRRRHINGYELYGRHAVRRYRKPSIIIITVHDSLCPDTTSFFRSTVTSFLRPLRRWLPRPPRVSRTVPNRRVGVSKPIGFSLLKRSCAPQCIIATVRKHLLTGTWRLGLLINH